MNYIRCLALRRISVTSGALLIEHLSYLLTCGGFNDARSITYWVG